MLKIQQCFIVPQILGVTQCYVAGILFYFEAERGDLDLPTPSSLIKCLKQHRARLNQELSSQFGLPSVWQEPKNWSHQLLPCRVHTNRKQELGQNHEFQPERRASKVVVLTVAPSTYSQTFLLIFHPAFIKTTAGQSQNSKISLTVYFLSWQFCMVHEG